MWAASWERTRKAWNFKGSGPGSAIYCSLDGGETWEKCIDGFPSDQFVGRIGLDLCASQPHVLYALLDNQTETKEEIKSKEGEFLTKDFADMDASEFLALDTAKLNVFLKDNGFPKKYDALKVKEEVRSGKYTPRALAEYFGDANKALFDTKVRGAEIIPI